MAIDAAKNREQFKEQLKFQLKRIDDMTDECFKHCGFYFYFNNGDKVEEGQDTAMIWYKGEGTKDKPFP